MHVRGWRYEQDGKERTAGNNTRPLPGVVQGGQEPYPSADLRPVRPVIKYLRRMLGDVPGGPRYIFTEPRVGYRMAGPEPPAC